MRSFWWEKMEVSRKSQRLRGWMQPLSFLWHFKSFSFCISKKLVKNSDIQSCYRRNLNFLLLTGSAMLYTFQRRSIPIYWYQNQVHGGFGCENLGRGFNKHPLVRCVTKKGGIAWFRTILKDRNSDVTGSLWLTYEIIHVTSRAAKHCLVGRGLESSGLRGDYCMHFAHRP